MIIHGIKVILLKIFFDSTSYFYYLVVRLSVYVLMMHVIINILLSRKCISSMCADVSLILAYVRICLRAHLSLVLICVSHLYISDLESIFGHGRLLSRLCHLRRGYEHMYVLRIRYLRDDSLAIQYSESW